MRPINERSKRTSIRRFVGYFLLAILPICAAVYLLAKVDDQENKHLREQVKEQRIVRRSSKALTEFEQQLTLKIEDFNELITAKSPNLAVNHHNEIQDKLEEIDDLLDQITKELEREDPKYNYLVKLVEFRKATNRFNSDIYNGVYEEWQNALDDLDDKEQTITRLNEDLRDYRGR